MKPAEVDTRLIDIEKDECDIVNTLLTERLINGKLITAVLLASIAVFLTIYHLALAGFGEADAMSVRSTDLFLIGSVIIIMKPLGRKSWKEPYKLISLVDLAIIIVAFISALNIIIDPVSFAFREMSPALRDYVLGAVMILFVLEISRRTLGWVMIAVPAFFMLHTVFGNYFPGILNTPPIKWESLITHLYVRGSAGIFGIPMGCLSSYIYVFLVFAAVLAATGCGKFLVNLSFALTGNQTGGPAKAAVLSSATMGTISGSAVANVVTTGSFTIPLMKRVGYPPYFAGAVEALASSGGQLMPPVMGAAAFIMAEFLGMPYGKIIIAAAIPAVLYFLSVFIAVHLRAQKLGLKTMARSELPALWPIIRDGWSYLIPLLVIVYLLLMGTSAQMAAVVSTFLVVILTIIHLRGFISKRNVMMIFTKALSSSLTVTSAVAAAGIVVGCVELSGVAFQLTTILVEWGKGHIGPILFITMTISLILGMGLPTSAVYILVATIVAPILIKIGVPAISAHMFVFYYGIIAVITPPVSVAAFAAAGIAESDPIKTGFEAFRIGFASYLVPFFFVLNPVLLAQGDPVHVVISFVTASMGIFALGAATEGWLITKMPMWMRVVLFANAILLIDPRLLTDAVGVGIMVLAVWLQKYKGKQRTQVANG